MTAHQLELALALRLLAGKLAAEGWDRLRGARLAHGAHQILEECRRTGWTEAAGRADALAELLAEFIQDTPSTERLRPALRAATTLADLLEAGRYAALVDRDMLPAQPGEWLFVLLGTFSTVSVPLADTLASFGFRVLCVPDVQDAASVCRARRTILVCSVAWLVEQGRAVDVLVGNTVPGAEEYLSPAPLLVALADSEDFLAQVNARKFGARLLLDMATDASRLITEMAGLAWMPRAPYRVLCVDDDESVLQFHADLLRRAGLEVLALADPVVARDYLCEFAPEACVLDVEMPACRGTDLAALLHRDKRFARLPVIYLSAFGDIEHQLEARHTGGEDYLTKPVDGRLLVAAVTARARQFRMFEALYRQRREGWLRLEHLREAIDAHALVSIAAVDGSIVDVNEKFCQVSGYGRNELLGHSHRIVKSGHHPAGYFDEMWQTIAQGRTWQGELKNRRKDGSHYWVQSTIVPVLDEEGLPLQYISLRTEVTEPKRILAEKERQSGLLDLLRRALQEFTANQDVVAASRLLLDGLLLLTNSAYGFLGEVLQDQDGVPYLLSHAASDIVWDEANRQSLARARDSGMEFRRLDSLYGAVLRTGAPVIANDPVRDERRGGLPTGHPSLDAFLGLPIHHGNKLVAMLGLANRPGGFDGAVVDFLQTFAASYAAIVEAARLRHFQQQAIQDMQRVRDAAEASLLAVAEEKIAQRLSAWVQEARTPLNAVLGHAQILQLHGTLDAQTRQQVDEIAAAGRLFSRLLGDLTEGIGARAPAKSPSPAVSDIHPEGAAPRYRILVAEDNPANQAVLRMQLGVLGFDVDMAADGMAAMSKWQSGGFDLILADRNMPAMDGLELARAIRAQEQESGAHVPMVAITAVMNPEDRAQCRQAGMDDTLPKPIELDDLRRMLETWLPPTPGGVLPRSERVSGTPAQHPGATLDMDYLVRIVGHVEGEKARELVDIFTATARADLPACWCHLVANDGRALALLMHKLKSSARMVGALRFASLAEMLEHQARTDQPEAAETLIRDLERALDDVEAAAGRMVTSPAQSRTQTGPAWLGPRPNRVLLVDDDPVARRQMGMLLAGLGMEDVQVLGDAATALAEIAGNRGTDLLISDLHMPGMDGIEFLRRLAEMGYQGDLILSSGVEERLLQTAAEFARARGMNLRGALKKPVMREELLKLLDSPREKVPALRGEVGSLSPQDIQDGIRHDEFELHFQPKVDAGSLQAVGVEALARWRHHGKSVSPDVFIAVAEQSGLIEQLSQVLVTKALIGGVRLEEAGFPLAVSVNVSANWLSDVQLPEFIMASIQATGFRGENLILEITESGLMSDMATALDVMSRLRLKGFKLSIDDYGTGYSSIEQLQRFPFGELKLDRSFVRGAAERPAARAILASTLEMAIKLNLATVAEGVETEADLDLVRGLGCDLIQGWLIAKAMPVEDLILWLKERGT